MARWKKIPGTLLRTVAPTVVLAAMAVHIWSLELVAPQPAYAYLDPGTGSLLFQWIIAGLVGSAFAIKIFWRRIVGRFKGRPEGTGSDESGSDD